MLTEGGTAVKLRPDFSGSSATVSPSDPGAARGPPVDTAGAAAYGETVRRARLFYGAALGLLLAAGAVRAEDAATPTLVSPTGQDGLDLSIRARALGIVPDPPASGAETLGLEPMRAPTGAGTTRMPQAAAGREPGVYVGVVVCEPDGIERLYMVRMDDAGTLPEGPLRTGAPGPRGLYLPGRPIP